MSSTTTFYAYNSSLPIGDVSAITDSVECTSVVGQDTLNSAIKTSSITRVEESTLSILTHGFGNHIEEQKSLFAIKFPFCFNAKKDGN